jgi:DNA invertase Pin-like site-specific DNA recombinase
MIYGYARVSTKSQEDNTSLDNQIKILKENGCEIIYKEVHTGVTMKRPEFMKLEKELKKGDTLIITKLDRFTRSTEKGIEKIKELANNDIKVNILNMGVVDLNNAMGKMMFTILCAFAEYEKDCIVERMREGKAIARQNPNYREGRKRVHKQAKVNHALELLKTRTYKEVELLTGISVSTLVRAKRKAKQEAY